MPTYQHLGIRNSVHHLLQDLCRLSMQCLVAVSLHLLPFVRFNTWCFVWTLSRLVGPPLVQASMARSGDFLQARTWEFVDSIPSWCKPEKSD